VAQDVSRDDGAVGVAADVARRSATDSAAPASADRYRAYARVAAAAFFLVAVYTLAVKLPAGEFDEDWLHTVLHVASGAAAVYVGWIARDAAGAMALTLAVAVVYGALGLGGWFVDGLFLDTTFRIPLGPADNVFHLVLAAGATATAAAVGFRRAVTSRE
jgi:hypothetical protein